VRRVSALSYNYGATRSNAWAQRLALSTEQLQAGIRGGAERDGYRGHRPRPGGVQRRRRLRLPGGAVLGWILLGAFALRLWSLKHGLPYVYSVDEEQHFVPHAVAMIGGSLNPHYFENPPALTYLLVAVFKLRFHAGFPFGSSGFLHSYRDDPGAVFATARLVVALLGTLSVGLVYWAGRRFYDRRVGLIAGLLMACAFLPVFYAKQALNDAVTLVPLTVALVACLAVYERALTWRWALAGGAIGVAVDVKYTAGAMVAVLALAALLRLLERRLTLRQVLTGGAVAGLALVVTVVALNPYALVDYSLFKHQVLGQAGTAGAWGKIGQSSEPGWIYYVWTLTWGLGWAPLAAAAVGAVLALRADRARALMLVTFPLLLWLFLGGQARHFGRWYMPAYPALTILAAYGAVRAVDALPAAWASRRRPVLVAVAAGILAIQSLWTSVRVDSVLAHTDTRTLARAWIERNVPAGSGLVVEPAVFPDDFLQVGEPERPYRLFPIKPPLQAYEKKLAPALTDGYRRGGFCWVVVASYQHDRGLGAGLPQARAYYRALDAQSSKLAVFSPYRFGAKPVKFNFDLSFNFAPRAYLRPGPLLELRRLNGCR
jgi:4-amino-4-deoxy-L-arabinose transferase-like glycosyltransferase